MTCQDECDSQLTCCDCGGQEDGDYCGCSDCWSCNACEECRIS